MNKSILDTNICHALDDERAENMFWRLRDRVGSLEAEKAALEWKYLESVCRFILPTAAKPYEKVIKEHDKTKEIVINDLTDWIGERQYRRYAPGF